MDYTELIPSLRMFVAGRDSVTAFKGHGVLETRAMEFSRVTAVHPFYPLPGWENHALPTTTHRLFTGAYRNPVALADAWGQACYNAGRVDSPYPESSRILVRGDGIADKPFTFHCGLVFADDRRKMSAFSQRDFVVGVFPEKNQFAMLFVATKIGDLVDEMRTRGSPVYLNADMTAIKNLSRGICHVPAGFGIKDFNASMLPNRL